MVGHYEIPALKSEAFKCLAIGRQLIAIRCVLASHQLHLEKATHSAVRQNQTHAATHNICGLCVPRRRCPVVPLSLRQKRESELQVFSCVLTKER